MGSWEVERWEQQLAEDYDHGKLERWLKELLDQRTPIYRGVGVSVQPTVSPSSAVQPAPSSSSAVQPAASSSSAKESH